MSLFSDERVDDIAEKIYNSLLHKKILLKDSKPLVKTAIRKGFVRFYRMNEQIDEIVRKKIKSMSKPVVEGSRDYRILYEKFFNEEWKKH